MAIINHTLTFNKATKSFFLIVLFLLCMNVSFLFVLLTLVVDNLFKLNLNINSKAYC